MNNNLYRYVHLIRRNTQSHITYRLPQPMRAYVAGAWVFDEMPGWDWVAMYLENPDQNPKMGYDEVEKIFNQEG